MTEMARFKAKSLRELAYAYEAGSCQKRTSI